ncbi:MAG: carboxypeptidase-like regulatory domain-containing protein [Chitinophagaceae bacterium]|nr:carboxypeptidase-like regulatory domain-containing protein [Chitinophagaceae bacterium]
MKKIIVLLILLFSLKPFVKAQTGFEGMVELTGIVMSADSLRYLPFVNVGVPSRNEGTTGSERGVFTIIVRMGDTLEFSSIGYRKKKYVIPQNLSSNRYSVIQLMVQDTFYLPATIIRPQLTREQFEQAFKNWHIPDDRYEIARKNTEYQTMRMLAMTMPKDGRESQHYLQSQQAQRNYWAGQQPPMTIFNPFAWVEFLNAWKRGDFKRKK